MAVSPGSAVYGSLVLTGSHTLSSTLLSVFMPVLAGGVAGLAAGALVYWLLGNREYRETISVMRGKLWRTKLPASQPIASAEEVGPSNP